MKPKKACFHKLFQCIEKKLDLTLDNLGGVCRVQFRFVFLFLNPAVSPLSITGLRWANFFFSPL
jgi:hypothetical protein